MGLIETETNKMKSRLVVSKLLLKRINRKAAGKRQAISGYILSVREDSRKNSIVTAVETGLFVTSCHSLSNPDFLEGQIKSLSLAWGQGIFVRLRF